MIRHIVKSALVAILFSLPLTAQENYKTVNTKTEYTNAHPYAVKTIQQVNANKRPKNIILMISDGMGHAHYNAALTANKGQLYINAMKYMGLSKTKSATNYITDSAAGGTAIACGQKTYNGAVGVDQDTVAIKSILEYAEAMGKASGLVATSSITHATPASFIAHQSKRTMYEEIAADFLKATEVDVIIGGGYKFFSKRKDKRNLIQELKDRDYTVSQSLEEVKDFKKGNLAVLLNDTHLPRYTSRGDMLPQATEKAIEVLDNNSSKGFFLMIEGSQIDWGGHQNDISYVVEEMLDFDRAVAKALEFAAKDGETLVIVTADHETGGIALQGGDESKAYIKASFSSKHHTGISVPVFAYGAGALEFCGVYENTEIFDKMAHLWKIDVNE